MGSCVPGESVRRGYGWFIMAEDHHEHDHSAHVQTGVYLTDEIAGIGGRLRERPEDFIVEEVPLYQPSGEGEHVYLFVQKVNMSTTQLVALVAKHFRVREFAVGYAGLKDKKAVTRQVLSVHVPGKKLEDFPSLQHDRVQVMWADMHGNKLRRGHLLANRFAIKIRGVSFRSVIQANRVLQTLAKLGVPNRAGEQRFGFFGNNHLVARELIKGNAKGALDELLGPKPLEAYPAGYVDERQVESRRLYAQGEFFKALGLMPLGATTECEALRALSRGANPEQAVRAINRTQRGFFISGFQSAVFNAVLERRMREGTFATLRAGDLAYKHDNGAVFSVDGAVMNDPETARRLQALEISPSGPNWGVKMMRAGGEVGAMELECLTRFGVSVEELQAFAERTGEEIDGDRRALRVPLTYPDVEAGVDEHGEFVRCSFELPPGAFATTVMSEIMKPERVKAKSEAEMKPSAGGGSDGGGGGVVREGQESGS